VFVGWWAVGRRRACGRPLGVRIAGLAFIDCSVKPPVNDRTMSVTVPYLAPYDWNPKEVE